MTRHQAPQLPLPCTIDEAVQLLDDVTPLRSKVQWQHAKIHALQEQLAAAQAELAQTRAEITALQMRLTAAQLTESALRTLLQRHVPSTGDMIPMDTIDGALRRLVTMAHSDKWSQGQPATALAHEVTVALNALRARVVEVGP